MDYSEEFTKLWEIYPKRAGGNPKPKAYKAFTARLKHGHTYNDIKEGLLRYAAFCDKTRLIGSPYVMQASTFFSANTESWLEDWEIPKDEIKETIEQKGMRLNLPARIGESMEQWERRITQAR